MEITQLQKSLRDQLMIEFQKRRKKNPAYSLRAFSRSLGVNDSTLSQLLRGKRRLSSSMIQRIGAAIGFRHTDAAQSDYQIPVLPAEVDAALADWYYDAIIELAGTDFKPFTAEAIAKELGIHSVEAQRALDTLNAVGAIAIFEDHSCNQLGNTTAITDPLTEQNAARHYQRSLLELSAQAVTQVPKPLRDHTSLVVAIEKDDIEEIRKIIASARRKIVRYLEESGTSKTDVYALQFSLFPLTQSSNQNSNEGDYNV